jgi:formamidopyrimidine-DNA glycosylase
MDRTPARGGAGTQFPEMGTAFRSEMTVHGRHKEPCPDCGSPVQRSVRSKSEANDCAPRQSDGKLVTDRALSRLLKQDWPRSLEELEHRRVEPRC